MHGWYKNGRIGAFGMRRFIDAYEDKDLSWLILRHMTTCFTYCFFFTCGRYDLMIGEILFSIPYCILVLEVNWQIRNAHASHL